MDDDQLIQQWELEVRDIDDRFTCHPSQQRWSSDERWERLEMLGRGGYGEVWLQKCTTGPRVGDLRAVKEIPKDVTKASEDGHAKIRHQELSALIKFSQQQYRDYFVSSFGWFQTPQALFITMQYFPEGDLQSHIAQALPNEEACTITRQILQGLSFMHRNKFAHRDLKPANILVQEKGPNWWVKLSDFGCSKEATTLRTTVGTPPYWAPELCHIFTRADEDAHDFVEHRTYSFQVDIWSAGVIAFRLATGVLPFGRNLHSELYCYVRRGNSLPSSPLLNDQSRPFMESLMSRSPGDRPTATQALAHPWISPPSPLPLLNAYVNPTENSKPGVGTGSEHREASGRWTTVDPSAANIGPSHSVETEAISEANIEGLADNESSLTKRLGDELSPFTGAKGQSRETSYPKLSLPRLFRHSLSFITRSRRSDAASNSSLDSGSQATEGDLRGSISSQATVPHREARPMITTSAETTMTLTVETGQDFLEMDKRLLSGTVTSVAFSPDGKWFASRRLPGDPEEGISGICIWKVDEQGVSRKSHSLTWECRRQMHFQVLFSSDSLGLVVFLERDSSRSRHEQLIAVSCILGARGYFEPVIGHYISNNKCVKRDGIVKNGRRIVLVWYDPKSKQRRMTIWDVNSEGDFEIFQEHEEPNGAFVWSEDGEQYLGVRADKTNGHHFSKSQTPGGMLLRQPLPAKYWLRDKAAFSPDGRWCAVDTLHSYQGLLVFEIMDGGSWEVHASLGCRGTVSSITFSPDSGTLVVSWWSNILCIWRLDSSDMRELVALPSYQMVGY